MKTSHFLIFTLSLLLFLVGCKSYQIDYRGPDEQKTYTLDKDKISKKEKAAWKKATDINSINAYKEYIKNFPNGKYVTEAQYNIDKAYDRMDELYALDSLDAENQNLAVLFNQPIKYSSGLEIIVVEMETGLPYEGAEIRVSSNCNPKIQTYTTNQKGIQRFKAKKGCCYNVEIAAPPFLENSRKICVEEFNTTYLEVFNLQKESKNGGGVGVGTGPWTANPIYNPDDGKYYDDTTGELFTGTFNGKKIKNGVDISTPKSASSEELLWRTIRNAGDIETRKKRMKIYLDKFPDGKYAELIKTKLEELEHTGSIGNTGGGSEPGGSEPPKIIDEEITTEEEEVTDDGSSTSWVTRPEPLITTTDTIVSINTLTDDCALDVKSKGLLAYNTLDTFMKIDTSYTLEILINDLLSMDDFQEEVEDMTGEELDTDELIYEGATTVGDNVVEMIRIGSWMRVTLTEPKNQNAFNISNAYETEEENLRGKNIDCDMNVKWKFLIEPKQSGTHTLLLNFYLKKTEDEPYKVLLDQEKIISVAVDKPWYAQFWVKGIFAVGLLSLILLWWRNKKKVSPQPDQIFGANLGIAGGLKEVAAPPTKPKSIFIAYAKEDEEWTRQIYNQMKVLHKGGYANIWYDQLMEAGVEYKKEIFKHLEASDIIMLNISSDFLACDFCDELLTKAMERYERGEGVVLIPIIVRPCLWATTPLAKMMVFPQNKKPLSDEVWKNTDNAIVNVMNEMENELLN